MHFAADAIAQALATGNRAQATAIATAVANSELGQICPAAGASAIAIAIANASTASTHQRINALPTHRRLQRATILSV